MKLTKPFLFVSIILLGCASCKNKAGTIEQENAELGTEEINDSVHQAQGIVMDATMMHFPGSVITHYDTFIPMGCKV